jgi:multidrug transporter EmrE-like cation transporter
MKNDVNKNQLLILMGYSILLCLGQGLFKLSAPTEALRSGPIRFIVDLIQNPIFVIACIVYALSTFAWVAILTRFQLSYAYPLVMAFVILLTTSMGILLFREQITFNKLAGIAMVASGVIILSKSN